MFSVAQRERVHNRVLEMAAADRRVVAGAVVGSLVAGQGDRWSDLDLTFAVDDRASVSDVLEDWTGAIVAEFDALQLFDLPSEASIYRVFLLPGCLQFDLSFTPARAFGARGPRFKLLFGSAVERPHIQPPAAHEIIGYAVHHALRARFCIERGRMWQAEYWLSAVRDSALSLACRSRDLPARDGRGFDQLPAELLDSMRGALVQSLERDELLRALRVAVAGLLREAVVAPDLAARIAPHMHELNADSLA
jgi:hypothetical protein